MARKRKVHPATKLLRQAARDADFDPFEADPELGPLVDLYVERLRSPSVHAEAKLFLRGWFEAMGLGLPPDLRLDATTQKVIRDSLYPDPRLNRGKLLPAPDTAHGNRYDLDMVLDAVLQSGARSKNEYDSWYAAQPKRRHWPPTYKAIYRHMTGQRKPGAARGKDYRKPGESAWDAAYRLAGRRKP